MPLTTSAPVLTAPVPTAAATDPDEPKYQKFNYIVNKMVNNVMNT